MASSGPDRVPADAGKAEKRSPRSIRFHDPEWERIEAFAETRGLAAAEFVRFAALAAIGDDSGASEDGDTRDRLAPLIERTFRYSYMIATKMRDDMREAGEDEELKALIDAARALQTDLLADDPE
ncbi:MAG: hypothetical protein OXC10_00375 [Rhodospirillaceae bacterium]|nr:hypothetical protein [Rhodospirillaceae bacterium]